MSTFQEIADDVSVEINQGTTLDAIILTKVYEAHRTLENNYTYQYMNVQRTLDQPADALTLSLTTGTKRVEMMRYDYEGQFIYLEKIHPSDPAYAETDFTKYWYLLGAVTVQLFKAFSEETTLTIIESVRTQTYAPTGEDWMTQQTPEAVKYMALALMAGPARDPDLATLYGGPSQIALNTAIGLDEELRRSTESPEARYG